MKIRTSFDNPPIPDRSFDWSAVTEDYDLGHPIGHGSTEAEAIADLKSQFASAGYETEQESLRSPCLSCHTPAILSDSGFCCDCQYELTILKRLRENKPVYVLTKELHYYKALTIAQSNTPTLYNVTVTGLSFPLKADLSDFHLSIPSLVTAGISRANDAILRFNQLHKQHIATNP